MAIQKTVLARNAACDAIVDLVDANTPTPGILEIYDSAVKLATFDFSDPAAQQMINDIISRRLGGV